MITVRYFAAARAAVHGRSSEQLDAATLGDLIEMLGQRHGPRLAKVLTVAGFLVDGLTRHDHQEPLEDGVTVDVLPPFAGG